MSRIKTVGVPSLAKYITFQIDGVAGSGKTTWLGTIGKGNKLLLLDLEGGAETFSSPGYEDIPDATEVSNISVVDLSSGITKAEQLVYEVEGVFDELITGKNADGYTLVAVDSLTEFQKRFLSLHQAADPRQSYGALSDAMYSIVQKARKAPVHVAFTSRPKLYRDEVLNRDVIRPDVAPSVWAVFSGLLSAVGYYSVRAQGASVKRTLDFSLNPSIQAKNRYGLGVLENVSAKGFFEAAQRGAGANPNAAPTAANIRRAPVRG